MPRAIAAIRAPEFETHARWLNSPPLRMEQLRGRPVLVDFWDFTCINCLRTLPYLREWHRRYAQHGLTVVGVHAPEFRFAREARQVEAALRRLSITWPVVLDNDFALWQAYANRYWPTKYLVDSRGTIRNWHSGEGGYAETEAEIQALLREDDPSLELPRLLDPLRDEDGPGAVCIPTTPELYAGLNRGAFGNPEGYALAPVLYRLPPRAERAEAAFYAEGTWAAGPEHFSFVGRSGRLVVPYRGASINAVLSPSSDPVEVLLNLRQAATLDVLLDGQPLPREEWGEDIYGEGGAARLRVDSPRMYSIAFHPEVRPRELELVVHAPGLTVYSFTFTSCVVPGQMTVVARGQS